MASEEVLERISILIPDSVIVSLAIMAHEQNMTLNDFIVGLAVKRAKEVIEEALVNGG